MSISVIIPYYNSKDTIIKCLESVLDQTLLPSDIYLINDLSKDNSLEIVSQYVKSIKKKYSNTFFHLHTLEKNSGPANARNFALDLCQTRFVAFLDSDDCWHKEKLERQLRLLKKENLFLISARDISTHTYSKNSKGDSVSLISPIQLLFRNNIPTPGVLAYNCEFLRFPSERYYSEDYFLWLNLVFIFKKRIGQYQEPLITLNTQKGPRRLSSNHWKMRTGELLNYRLLYKERKIGISLCILASLWSLIKFLKLSIENTFNKLFFRNI